MDMIYVDIVLLVILCFLTIFMCGYGFYCLYRLIRSMQMQILLRPTRVLFSHRKEGQANEELRTVVAYQNPFTGDYCIHKSRLGPQGYVNALHAESPDSGLSDEYEPLHLEPLDLIQPPRGVGPVQPPRSLERPDGLDEREESLKHQTKPTLDDNAVNKTWNWNYKEYQI